MKNTAAKSSKIKSNINLFRLIYRFFIFLIIVGLFANFHCQAEAVQVACQWRKLRLSWLYTYPYAMFCKLKTNPIGFLVRIVCAPLGGLRAFLCFIRNFVIPQTKVLYYTLFDPFISLFRNIKQAIIAFAFAHPSFCLKILYFVQFLLSPIRLLVALLSPIVKCNKECEYTSECIACRTGHLFYYPLRFFEIPIVTVDDWIRILKKHLEGEPIIDKPEEIIQDEQKQEEIKPDDQKEKEIQRAKLNHDIKDIENDYEILDKHLTDLTELMTKHIMKLFGKSGNSTNDS